MNLFSSFTFGRLIKTFFPGFILLISAILILDVLSKWFHQGKPIIDFQSASQHGAEMVAICIALSMLLGLLSNTFVFAGFNDFLVRRNVKKNYRNIFEAKSAIEKEISLKCIDDIKLKSKICDEDAAKIFIELDAEYIAMHEFDSSKMIYIQEQYWYYMELHTNLALSILVMCFSFVMRDVFVNSLLRQEVFFRDLAAIFIAIPMACFLITMARVNYRKHNTKMLSLLSSYFREMQSDDVPKGDGAFLVCPGLGGPLGSR